MDNIKIVSENDVEIRGVKYKEIIYEDGKKILKTYNDKYKAWIILKFKDDNYNSNNTLQRGKKLIRELYRKY